MINNARTLNETYNSRRVNYILRMKIEKMNDDEKFNAIYTHPVTDALNRRAYEDYGKLNPGIVVMADLNFFKQINDLFSYEVGDKVLSIFTESLSCFFEYGNVYHTGGDEFIIKPIFNNIYRVIDLMDKVDAMVNDSLFNGVLSNPIFSYGIADNERDSNNKLHKSKSMKVNWISESAKNILSSM